MQLQPAYNQEVHYLLTTSNSYFSLSECMRQSAVFKHTIPLDKTQLIPDSRLQHVKDDPDIPGGHVPPLLTEANMLPIDLSFLYI